MKKTLLSALLTLFTVGAMAQQTEIFPNPQEVVWGADKAFDNTLAYTLVGAAEADADAVALLDKHFTTEGGAATPCGACAAGDCGHRPVSLTVRDRQYEGDIRPVALLLSLSCKRCKRCSLHL